MPIRIVGNKWSSVCPRFRSGFRTSVRCKTLLSAVPRQWRLEASRAGILPIPAVNAIIFQPFVESLFNIVNYEKTSTIVSQWSTHLINLCSSAASDKPFTASVDPSPTCVLSLDEVASHRISFEDSSSRSRRGRMTAFEQGVQSIRSTSKISRNRYQSWQSFAPLGGPCLPLPPSFSKACVEIEATVSKTS